MRLPSTPVTELQRALRDEVRAQFPAGRVVVAVDGDDTAAFADGLAEVFRESGVAVFRARIANFQLPRAERAGATGAARYNTATLARVLIDPFRDAAHTSATTGFQLAAFDAERDMPVGSRWVTGPASATLVIDGPDLFDDRLVRLWDWRIRLVTGESVGISQTPDAVVDVTDPAEPKQVG
ncbi:MAG TPA: uridine kinase [Microbacterium sp.]|uniref:uridine kinase n=1 Tax=Microbacterium sp. TaxID=51671 RepID=UPI002B4758D2|nr:uridine kinase [Microbacterium sp.]HKT55650.1 uridine kinase [Microbacterium sp.]